jgi:hypothetical protein
MVPHQNGMFETSVPFTGEFSSNFYLKNMILTYTKDFAWAK